MKKSIFTLFVIPAFLGLTSFQTVTPENCTITVRDGKITVQGTEITPGWEVSKFKTALGDSARERDGYNKTHTYDNLSVVLFEPKVDEQPGGKVSEFQVFYKVVDPNNVTPKNDDGFKGTLTVDKFVVTKDLSASTMLKKLKGWEKTDSYIEHSYRMAKKAIYIYFQFDDSETSLLKVSIGLNKKYTSK